MECLLYTRHSENNSKQNIDPVLKTPKARCEGQMQQHAWKHSVKFKALYIIIPIFETISIWEFCLTSDPDLAKLRRPLETFCCLLLDKWHFSPDPLSSNTFILMSSQPHNPHSLITRYLFSIWFNHITLFTQHIGYNLRAKHSNNSGHNWFLAYLLIGLCVWILFKWRIVGKAHLSWETR